MRLPSARLSNLRKSHALREALRLAPARPNVPSGLRAALATALPLLALGWMGDPQLAWTSLAGFNTVLVDKGGAYRTRALTMLALAVFGSWAVLVGTLAAPHPWLSVPLVFAVAGVGGFVRLFGAEATTLGVTTSIAFVLALTRPAPDLSSSLSAAGFFALGAGWAALISLVLWPLRPFRPASQAVGAAFRELALVADGLIGGGVEPAAQVARRALLGHTREKIEGARAALGVSRRARPGPSRRGEQLVTMLEAADQLFAAMTAIDDALALSVPADLPLLPQWIDAIAKRIAGELRRAAEAVEHERLLAPSANARPSFATVVEAIEPRAEDNHEYLPLLLARAIERLELLLSIASRDPQSAQLPSADSPRALRNHGAWRTLARDHMTLDSAILRHALRVAISTSIAVRVMHALALEHGYWATLTCVVIMQPHGTATWTKALQRVGGTILGAGVAVLVASFVHQPLALIGFVALFVALGMALLPINYGAQAVFLTPAFVLLAETQAGNPDLAGVRVLNTLLGAGIALLGSRLLFPLSERDQFRPLMGKTMASVRALLAVAALPPPRARGALRAARQDVGLSLLNAEASYQRLLTESPIAPDESEALLTLLLYTHRLTSGLIALALVTDSPAHQRLMEQKGELMVELAELEHAVRERGAPLTRKRNSTRPPIARAAEQGERVEVLYEQLEVLRNAVARWNACEARADDAA